MRLLKKTWFILVILLPLSGLLSIVLQIIYIQRVPSESNWVEAAELLRKNFQDGDIIRFSPSWGLEGLRFFKGLEVDLTTDLELPVIETYKRLWIIGHLGEKNPELPSNFELVEQHNLPKITITLYKIPSRGKPLYDFLDKIGEAKVRRIYPNRIEECRLFDSKKKRWFCGKPHPWQYVGEVIRDIAGSRRRAIWAHPIHETKSLEIEYENVPAGEVIEVFFGFTQRAIESDNTEKVTFAVYVNEILLLSEGLENNPSHWHHRILDTSALKGKEVSVKFVTSTRKEQGRQFCFLGRVW